MFLANQNESIDGGKRSINHVKWWHLWWHFYEICRSNQFLVAFMVAIVICQSNAFTVFWSEIYLCQSNTEATFVAQNVVMTAGKY